MIKRLSIAAVVSLGMLAVNSAAAMAAGDPTQVGKNIEDIFSPNAKSFWKVAVVAIVLFGLFTRKYNVMGISLVFALIGGAIIWDPAGFGDFASNIGHRVFH